MSAELKRTWLFQVKQYSLKKQELGFGTLINQIKIHAEKKPSLLRQPLINLSSIKISELKFQ